jgi:hypothetical protein
MEETAKTDLSVEIKADSIRITLGQGVLLSGPLTGRVDPRECSWVLCDAEPRSRVRGRRLSVYLLKSAGSRGIWASLIRPDYLAQQQEQGNQ